MHSDPTLGFFRAGRTGWRNPPGPGVGHGGCNDIYTQAGIGNDREDELTKNKNNPADD